MIDFGVPVRPAAPPTRPPDRVRFDLGSLYITPGALELRERERVEAGLLLVRRMRGDLGELDAHDVEMNNKALVEGTRLLSSYPVGNSGKTVWAITEADRLSTTVLLPGEY